MSPRVSMGEIQGPVLSGRRSLLLGMAAFASAALSACSASVDEGHVKTRTTVRPVIAEPVASPAVTPQVARTPAPQPPSREQIVAEFSGRLPSEWGLQVTGVVTSSSARQIALTFDACGGPGGTGCDHELLATLRQLKVPATLFVNERWIRSNSSLALELAQDPLFELANHGYRHLPLSVSGRSAYGIAGTADVAQVYDELMGNQEVLRGITGHPARFFRSGTAHYDEVAASITRRVGMLPVNFTINGDAGATFPAATVADAVGKAGPGDIVIAHFNKPGSGTAAGFRQVLPQLLDNGASFAPLGRVLPG